MTPGLKVPIELTYALSIFAIVFAESISTNWAIYRTCYTTLGFNKSDCALLGSGNSSNSTIELEKEVQPYVTVIVMVKSIIQAILAATICLFIGPWSDKYGRKPVLLFSFASYALSYGIMAVITAIPNLSPWYILLSTLPSGLTGGFIAQLTAVLCYISDTTTESNRGFRLAVFEAASTGGSLIGTLSSSYVLSYCGYTVMYAIATGCYIACSLIMFFFIPESVRNVESDGRFHSFFQLSFLRKSLNATFKKRSDYKRAALLMIIAVLLTYVIAFTEIEFTFLYLRKTFNWSLKQFTIFNGGTTVTGVFGTVVGVYLLHKLFKVNESILILLGLLSACSSALVVAFATNNWHIYASGAIKCVTGTISPMARSLISKEAVEDSGAVFGFLSVCETLTMLIGRFIYTYIYNETICETTAVLYYFTAGDYLVAIILSIILILLQKRKSPVPVYHIMENEVG